MSEEQIGKYKILSELGKGSMGVVYLAEDPEIGRQVAIKTLRSIYLGEDAAGQEALQRFRQESRSACRLKHANIITIFEAGRTQTGSPFIVMEFVDGESLEETLAKSKKLEPLEALHLLAQIASAIDYAHTFDIIHRDIKPSNVILDSSKKPFLLGFGVAKLNDTSLTPAGTVVGTPSYMAPEQIRGESLTSATDRFAFAVLTYEMLTGLRPFPGTDFMSVASNIIHSEPIKFSEGGIQLDPKFEPVLRKGLSKEQKERFSSCLEFIREIGKQFDIPIDQSGVLGFRIGMTLQDLYPKKKDGPPTVSTTDKSSDSDVAATVMGQAIPEVKKPGKTSDKPTASVPSSVPTAPTDGVREGGGKGIAIVVGALFLLVVATGVYYLLQGGKSADEEVASTSDSENSITKTTENSSTPSSQIAAVASLAPVGEVTPGCGLGTGCSDVSSVSILGKEELNPATEAVNLKSEIPGVSVTPEFAQGVDAALLAKLFSPDTTADKLIELIPTVGQLPYDQSGPLLLKLVSHSDFKVRIAVLKVFTSSEKFRTREVFRTIVEKLDDSEYLVRGFSAKFLSSLKSEAAKKILSERLKVETDPTVRKVIENALASKN